MRIEFDSQNIKQLNRKMEKLSNWGLIDYRKLRSANRKILKVYVKTARSRISNMNREETSINGNTITRGQLRRSVGVWKPYRKDRRSNALMAGPRASQANKKIQSYSRKDGWFAHLVEQGVAGGKKYRGKNTGVFTRSLQSSQSQMEALQRAEYRKAFGNFVKKL